ncbi:uncharacterized protein LOC125053574 [Pieris napi]|uniref:uncharacterized protein LOC125053574 n=1 Tax=Pieris napi TaxID=78633 RepID=UPI001FBB4F80|nr:uncharacterized protein LOC125053574 [Pieris napi]
MKVLQKKIQLSKDINQLKGHLLYPKVVIIENAKTIIVIDLQIEELLSSNNTYTFCHEIVQHIFDGYFLWVALKSLEVFVINLNKNSMLKLIVNNFANYKICGFESDESKLILISASGERLLNPCTKEELCAKFDNNAEEITVSLQKVSPPYKFKPLQKFYENGLHISVQNMNLSLKCPVTGIVEKLSTNKDLEFIVSWDDAAVFSTKQEMWMIDLTHFNKLVNFEKVESHYIPLGSYDNIFYYLTWDTEVQIFSTTLKYNENPQLKTSTIPMQISQETLKAQLKSLIQEVIAADTKNVSVQLQNLFNNIQDSLFLIEMAAKLCKHNILYKSILCSIQKKIFLTEDIAVTNAFHDLMIKLDLLEYIYFRRITHYIDMDLFRMNIIEMCELFVSKSDLDLASICWLKYSKLSKTTTDDDIMKILNAIPVNIKLGALVIWLRNFIPTLLDENPFNVDLIAKWTSERIFSLEQSTFWPKIGLKYLEAILEVFESSQKTITIRPISIDDLDILKDHIKYIIELKEKYKINMLITEITSQSPTEVALIMLRRCYTEDLEHLLKDNLTSYANRYQFDLDLTICSFIEMQAASSGGSVDGQRLEILLNSIHSLSNRLECFLQVLKFLDVPWDPKIEEIAKSVASLAFTDFTLTESDRILAQGIYEELKDAKFKVILKKYNLPLHSFDCNSLIHKIVSAPSIELNDLQTVTNYVSPHTRHYANGLYINRCLKECETKVALDFFRSLPKHDQKILIKSIVIKYEHIISGPSNKLLERNYLDFIKGSNCQDVLQINAFEKMYHLKNTYDIRSELNDLCDEEFYEMKLEFLKKIDNSGRSRYFERFTTLDFLNSQHSKLEAFLHKTSANERVRIIVKQLICIGENKSNEREILNQFKDGENVELLLLSQSVLSDLISDCPEEYIHVLCKILSMLNAIINTSTILKNLSVTWKFNYIFLPMSSNAALNNLVDFYVNHEEANVVYDGNDFISLRIIAHSFLETLISERHFSENLLRITENVAQKLLNKVLASQELDQVILTALLLVIYKSPDFVGDKMYILELLQGRSEKYSPSIMYYLSSPAIRHTFGLETVIPSALTYPPQYILQSKFNIYLGDIALPDYREETWDVKMLLFYILRQQPDTSFERLTELCHTLNVCINDGLSLLLISFLINWNLQYKTSINDIGCRDINLENDEDRLISKCLTIWQNIENKDFLKDVLKDFWKNGEVVIHGCVISINPYYYEVLLCIYYLLVSSFSDSKYLNEYFILNFLKEYQRQGTPKQYEFEAFSVKGLFPEIGHYRLPFHLFIRDDMWLNLKSEITLATYERWLPVVGNLSLDADTQTAKDMICSNAVKQTMTNRRPNNTTETDTKDDIWKLTSYEEPLLRAAHRCVRHIANMEWAGACLFYVLQGCARGADQVAAAQLCYQFSQRWAAVQPGNRAVRQMERLHSTLSTRHVLHKIDWACEEFIRLTSEPSQLIHALYLHPNFVEKIGRHNINRAANEIADKNGININSIRIQILENLLDKNKDKQSPSLNNIELITAKYILKVTCPKMGAIYLSRIAIDDENDHNKIKKLRALQCLMSVVDQEIAVKVANKDHQNLWPTLLELLYTVHFERIDMPWLVSSFKKDKINAISQLTQTSGTSIEALKVSAELAYRYGDLKSIRDLIPLLLKTSLHEELIPLLLKMSHPLDSSICLAWRAVILSPFQKADYPITEKQKTKCLKAINLLPLCPVIKDEDLLEIWKNCIRCKCPALGCLILPYMSSESRDNLTEISRYDKRNLIIGLKNLHAESYLVSSAMCVIESMTIKLKR